MLRSAHQERQNTEEMRPEDSRKRDRFVPVRKTRGKQSVGSKEQKTKIILE